MLFWLMIIRLEIMLPMLIRPRNYDVAAADAAATAANVADYGRWEEQHLWWGRNLASCEGHFEQCCHLSVESSNNWQKANTRTPFQAPPFSLLPIDVGHLRHLAMIRWPICWHPIPVSVRRQMANRSTEWSRVWAGGWFKVEARKLLVISGCCCWNCCCLCCCCCCCCLDIGEQLEQH